MKQSAHNLPAAPPALSNYALLKRMLSFVIPVWGWALLACSLVLVWVALEIGAVTATRHILNRVRELFDHTATTLPANDFWLALHQPPLTEVELLIIILGLLVILNGINTYFRGVSFSRFVMEGVYYMRSAMYDRLQRVGFAFYDTHSSGALINRALSDLQNVRSFVQNGLTTVVEIVAFVVGYNLLMLTISPWVALLAMLPVPFWILYILRYSRQMQPAQDAAMTAGDDVVTVFTEAVAGVHVVKAFATEATEIQKYRARLDAYFAKVMQTVKLQRNFQPGMRGIAGLSHLSLFALGAVLCVTDADKATGVRVGDLVVFGTAMGAILGRLQLVSQLAEQYQKAIVSARRFFEVLDAQSTLPQAASAPVLPPGPGAVEFNFVTFGYDPAKPVVCDISFDVPGGSVVALVGPTGAGKSTIMQLLARFYDPQSGQIFIDGQDLRTANLPSVRQAVGFVFQETFLFSDSVANNIRYGKPEASLGEVEAAARLAQAHDFIMEMPRGYDTPLGERGANLSGGQRARLAIARAILTNPRILVMDDALAAVDPATEHLISRALELVMVDRTVFIIAHRLSTVKYADLVIVIEGGRITQAGTHKELLREPGHYREIAEVQLAFREQTQTPGA